MLYVSVRAGLRKWAGFRAIARTKLGEGRLFDAIQDVADAGPGVEAQRKIPAPKVALTLQTTIIHSCPSTLQCFLNTLTYSPRFPIINESPICESCLSDIRICHGVHR